MMNALDPTYLLKENDKLFEATLDQFSSRPYDLVSTNEIIQQAEYNKGSFYYRFKTKEELYFALVDYVYVQQISLFNQQNRRLVEITSLAEVFNLAWINLQALFVMDFRYYDLLKIMDHESDTLKEQIHDHCIESLYLRFLTQIKHIVRQKGSTLDFRLLESLFCHLYHHFPWSFADPDFLSKSHDLSCFLAGETTVAKAEILGEKLILGASQFKADINLLLTDLPVLIDESHDIGSMMADQKTTIDIIRQRLKIRKVSLKTVIESGIMHNLKDYSHLLKMDVLPQYDTSFHQLNTTQKALLMTTYLVVLGEPSITIRGLFDNHQIKYLEGLYGLALPLLAKTSKIIVLDSEIAIDLDHATMLYSITRDLHLSQINPDRIKRTKTTRWVISYMDPSGHLASEVKALNTVDLNAYIDKPLLQIKNYQVVTALDLMEEEV